MHYRSNKTQPTFVQLYSTMPFAISVYVSRRESGCLSRHPDCTKLGISPTVPSVFTQTTVDIRGRTTKSETRPLWATSQASLSKLFIFVGVPTENVPGPNQKRFPSFTVRLTGCIDLDPHPKLLRKPCARRARTWTSKWRSCSWRRPPSKRPQLGDDPTLCVSFLWEKLMRD